MNDGIMISGTEKIRGAQILVMRSALRLELKTGMKASRHANPYKLAKELLGFKGSKRKVLEQLDKYISENILKEGTK